MAGALAFVLLALALPLAAEPPAAQLTWALHFTSPAPEWLEERAGVSR